MEISRSTPRDLDGAPGVVMTSLLELASTERAYVHIAELSAGSSLPKHPAGPDQLFYVGPDGEAWRHRTACAFPSGPAMPCAGGPARSTPHGPRRT